MRLKMLALLVCGCVDVRGGAVELAWELFAEGGSACCPNKDPCKAAGAVSVRVHLFQNGCGGTEAVPVQNFSCNATQGATQFIIPPGSYCITVDAADSAGNPVASGPSPIVRDVVTGDVVELGAVALTVTDPAKCPDDAHCP